MNSQVKRKIRVLHVYRTYFPDTQGGLEEAVRQISLNAQGSDIESRIFSLSENPQPPVQKRPEGILYRFKKSFEIASCGVSLSSLSGFRELVDWADIVHYQFPWPFADFLHFFGRVNKPSLVTYQSDIIRQKFLLKLYRFLMNQFLGSVSKIVATSENYVHSSNELCLYKDKIHIIPLGLDESSYPQVSSEELNNAKEKYNEGFFLFVGVLRYYKGLHILLDALQNTSAQCLIVGSGPEEQALKNRAAQLGLDNVHFLGRITDGEKVALMKLCRAVIFPSHLRSEAFGVTLLEGAMYGKPMISTEIGTGTSFVNLDGQTGFVVPPSDPEALKNAISTLDQDHELAERFGKAARSRYETEFTGQLMGQRYARLYKEMHSSSCDRS